jgi:putative sterol carrier protein
MAAEEKKPRIDLKARLGRAQAGVGGPPAPAIPAMPGRTSSVVPPVGLGSTPPPLGSTPPPMPAGFGGASGPGVGVPVPPFGSSRPAADPFGAPVAASAVPRAMPQTIKIELDEETMRAARGGKRPSMILGGITLVIGLGVGFMVGGRYSDSKGANIAVQGAQELVGDIEKSQAKIKELTEKIGAAVKDLKDRKFPEAFANDLGGLSIPFGADKLAGRNIGRFDARTLQMLFSYTNDVEALNDRKDAMRNLFSGQKKAILDALGAAQTPKVGWSLFVQKSPAHGPVGILAAINPSDAFGYKEANWPSRFKISNGRELVDTERYAGGDVTSTDKRVVAIPIDPDSVVTAFPNDILSRITGELAKTEAVLAGSGTPGADDETGVVKKGDQLLATLKKIGQKP